LFCCWLFVLKARVLPFFFLFLLVYVNPCFGPETGRKFEVYIFLHRSAKFCLFPWETPLFRTNPITPFVRFTCHLWFGRCPLVFPMLFPSSPTLPQGNQLPVSYAVPPLTLAVLFEQSLSLSFPSFPRLTSTPPP